MLTFVMIMIAILITCYVNYIIEDIINIYTIDAWNNKLEQHNSMQQQMQEEDIWMSMVAEAHREWKEKHMKEQYREVQPAWHDLMAQRLLVGGVWAHNIYQSRRSIMLGLTDPANLDPRNMPTAEQAEKQEQQNMINNIRLMVRLGEMAHEMYLNIKWSAQQAYYRYRSERARSITPGTVRTLTTTTTGGSSTPVTIPTYTYHTSVQ